MSRILRRAAAGIGQSLALFLFLSAPVLAEGAGAPAPPASIFAFTDSRTGASAVVFRQAPAVDHVVPAPADFKGEVRSRAAQRVADWATASNDNGGLPFVIIDKIDAKVFAFDRGGRLRGAAPVLVGRALGDDTVPGIGHRTLAEIRADERTTPAGRFVASLGRDLEQDILWIDYDAGLSMHRVIVGEPGENRFKRLASTDPTQRRISFGCINVPAKFYDDVVAPTFSGTSGIVYILPEVKSLTQVFGIPEPG